MAPVTAAPRSRSVPPSLVAGSSITVKRLLASTESRATSWLGNVAALRLLAMGVTSAASCSVLESGQMPPAQWVGSARPRRRRKRRGAAAPGASLTHQLQWFFRCEAGGLVLKTGGIVETAHRPRLRTSSCMFG